MYGTTTTIADPWSVRIQVTAGGYPITGATPEVVVVYVGSRFETDRNPPMGAQPDPFIERALTALERRQARMAAAFELRVVETRHRRATPPKRPTTPARRSRCCSLAAAWRTRP